MKKIIALALASTSLLSACSSMATQAKEQKIVPTSALEIRALWQLKSAPKSFRLPEKTELDLREPKKASAYMGCNGMRFAAQIALDLGSLKADTITSTLMYCPEYSQLESSFAQLLREGAQVVWQEEQLVLVDKAGATWIFKQASN
ncbi:META domain-containing protein [Neisseriaceae bacterium B1]